MGKRNGIRSRRAAEEVNTAQRSRHGPAGFVNWQQHLIRIASGVWCRATPPKASLQEHWQSQLRRYYKSSIKRNIRKLCAGRHGSRLYRRTDRRLHPITVSWRTRVCGAVRKSVAWRILRVGRASLWTRVLQGWQSPFVVLFTKFLSFRSNSQFFAHIFNFSWFSGPQ